MKVLFVAGFGPIVRNEKETLHVYKDLLGLPLEEKVPGYYYTESIPGAKHFSLWPLADAAESCFGTREWPKDVPVPQSWMEFDVEDIDEATKELEAKGCKLLVKSRKEPWGQTVTRFLSPEGILLGVTYTSWMRK